MSELSITKIRTDGGTQARAGLDSDTVNEYRTAFRNTGSEGGVDWPFPPVIVVYDGAEYWLADGFHRIEAARLYGRFVVEAEVQQGTRRDAVLFAAGANADHGLRRTTEDKRRAVMRLLDDEEWGQWSDREIARRCKVSPTFVGGLRVTVHVDSEELAQRTYTNKHGNQAVMNTAAIGSGNRIEIDKGRAYDWLRDYEDANGRSWQDLEDNQVHHANSPCYQAYVRAFPDQVDPKFYLKYALYRLRRETGETAVPPWRVLNGEQGPTIREKLKLYAESLPSSYDSIIDQLAHEDASGHEYRMDMAVEAMGTSAMFIQTQAMIIYGNRENLREETAVVNELTQSDLLEKAIAWLVVNTNRGLSEFVHFLDLEGVPYSIQHAREAFAEAHKQNTDRLECPGCGARSSLPKTNEDDFVEECWACKDTFHMYEWRGEKAVTAAAPTSPDAFLNRAIATEAAEIEEMFTEKDKVLELLKQAESNLCLAVATFDTKAHHDAFVAANSAYGLLLKSIKVYKDAEKVAA